MTKKGKQIKRKVPDFQATGIVDTNVIFRDIPTKVIEILIPTAFRYAPDIALTMCLQAFAGLRASEAMNDRQESSPYGHSWKTHVYNRYNGTKCPYCSVNRPVTGVNDLATMRPELISEWCYELNDIAPDKVTVYSNRKVWWRCRHNHRWEAVIYERTVTRTGCPYCCGKKTVPGKTDLLTLYPELNQEWDYQMNVNVDPKYIRPSSGKAVWWKCKNGHKWKAQVNMRTSGRGCPYCSGKTPVHASLI